MDEYICEQCGNELDEETYFTCGQCGEEVCSECMGFTDKCLKCEEEQDEE